VLREPDPKLAVHHFPQGLLVFCRGTLRR
jgi:hypothetical protein